MPWTCRPSTCSRPNVTILPQPDTHDGFSLLLAETDNPHGSWAACDRSPASDLSQVTQYGHRRLWDELETAYHQWTGHGAPGPDRFGMTVTADEQLLWLDRPNHILTRNP